MPQRKAGLKDLRKNYRRRMQNMDVKTDIRKTVKKFQAAVGTKNKAEVQSLLKVLFKKFDKAANSKLFHKNTAARRKSHFSRLAAALS